MQKRGKNVVLILAVLIFVIALAALFFASRQTPTGNVIFGSIFDRIFGTSSVPSGNVGAQAGMTYYVSTSGNNANTGTDASHPWSTLAYSVTRLSAGDTLIISGTFNEPLIVSSSGNVGAPITFIGNGAIISGVSYSWGGDSIGTAVGIRGNYVVVDNVHITYPFQAGGITSAVDLSGNYDVFKNSEIYGLRGDSTGTVSGDTTIACQGWGSNNLVTNNSIYDGQDMDVFRSFGTYNTYSNNTIENLSNPHYYTNSGGTGQHPDFVQVFGLSGGVTHDIIIEGNIVKNSAIQLGCLSNDANVNFHDITFRNNIFTNVGGAMFTGVPRTNFYNNVFYNVGSNQGYALDFYQSGSTWDSTGNQVINNAFVNCPSSVNFPNGVPPQYVSKTNYISTNPSDPNFVNAQGLNFHLKSTATALIGNGTVLSPIFSDKDGNARTGAWDIGAYEYTVAGPINGVCDTNNKYQCTSGLSSNQGQNSTHYTWKCIAQNGGTVNASCSLIIPPTNGVCGANAIGNYAQSEGFPRGNLCDSGINNSNPSLTATAGSTVSWQCLGLNGGTPASCSATRTSQAFITIPVSGAGEYTFNIATAGVYKLTGNVSAPDDGSNSFFIDIDNVPGTAIGTTDDMKCWDLAITGSGVYAPQDVSWRGNNYTTCSTYDCAQLSPKNWTLSAGTHTLNVGVRESGSAIQSVKITSLSTQTQTLAYQTVDTNNDWIISGSEINSYTIAVKGHNAWTSYPSPPTNDLSYYNNAIYLWKHNAGVYHNNPSVQCPSQSASLCWISGA